MDLKKVIEKKPWVAWTAVGGLSLTVFALGLLASRITERRLEVRNLQPQVKLAKFEPRNEIFGKYYPREFETYYQTADTSFKSMFKGNAMIDELAANPRNVVLWAGYAFSKDYNQARGHYYAIEDIRNTLRTGTPKDAHDGPQPATCWTCKSPDVPRLMEEMGPAEFYKGKWAGLGHEVVNTIGCADCHDPSTMSLRISRPALKEAFDRQGKDITKSGQQEMRSLVCAQCHVEYYFKGDGKYLTFPWDKGTTAEEMEQYYDENPHTDWVHAISKTPMLKAQHPDFETYKEGIHGRRGVSCADCHMPYKSEGGVKFTNHKIQSPLNNIANSCLVCHRESEDEIRRSVYSNQLKVKQLADRAEEILIAAHFEAKAAWDAGAKEDEMKPALKLIRQAQWRWDYSTAGHGASFHAPVEISRTLGAAIDKAAEARLALTKVLVAHNVKTPVAIPDISTKEKAQKAIGLDMPKLNAEKEEWKKKTLPEWDQQAKERQVKMPESL